MERLDIDWALAALGLEPEEGRLYRILVSRGPSTVGALAPSAEMSRTKVYSVLDGMVAKGYAERVTDRPRTYVAVDPDRLVRRRLEDFGSAKEVIELELSPLFQQQRATSRHMSLRGNAVFRRAEEMLGRARNDIVFVVSFVPQELVSRLTTIMGDLRDRGVCVRTVVSDAVEDSVLLGHLRALSELRVRKVPNAGMLIVDDEEVLIGSLAPTTSPDDDKAKGISRLQGLWSRDAELIKLQRMLFDEIYNEGVA